WDGVRVKPLAFPRESHSERITFAHADNKGRLWIGFAGGLLAIAEPDGTVHGFGAGEGLPDNVHKVVHAVFEDREGTVWIGGSGGLTRVADGRCVTVNGNNGLPGD